MKIHDHFVNFKIKGYVGSLTIKRHCYNFPMLKPPLMANIFEMLKKDVEMSKFIDIISKNKFLLSRGVLGLWNLLSYFLIFLNPKVKRDSYYISFVKNKNPKSMLLLYCNSFLLKHQVYLNF